MLDFDNNGTWGSLLTLAVGDLLSKSIIEKLVAAAPEYIEDARDQLFSFADPAQIIEATLTWIRSTKITGYHGSRLIDSEVDSIRANGILPLDAGARRTRLTRALSSHPRWNQVAHGLDAALHGYGVGGTAGFREGQVHLTLSRSGLVNGFTHYLAYGSEFDQQVARALLGADGKNLLSKDGRARVIRVAVPGEVALQAANPYFTIELSLSSSQVPNLVDEFLKSWSYGLAHPDFECATLRLDCGMVSRSAIPSSWIVDIDTLSI